MCSIPPPPTLGHVRHPQALCISHHHPQRDPLPEFHRPRPHWLLALLFLRIIQKTVFIWTILQMRSLRFQKHSRRHTHKINKRPTWSQAFNSRVRVLLAILLCLHWEPPVFWDPNLAKSRLGSLEKIFFWCLDCMILCLGAVSTYSTYPWYLHGGGW